MTEDRGPTLSSFVKLLHNCLRNSKQEVWYKLYSFTVLGDDGAVVVVDAGAEEGSGGVLHLYFAILHINPIDVLGSPIQCRCYFGLLDRQLVSALSRSWMIVSYLWFELDKGLWIYNGLASTGMV